MCSRSRCVLLLTLLCIIFVGGSALAATHLENGIGNEAVDTGESIATTAAAVDSNNPAKVHGTIDVINYHIRSISLDSTGQIRFVLADEDRTITWVSDPVTVTVGFGSYLLPEPIVVSVGDNLGFAGPGAGVLSPSVSAVFATEAPPYVWLSDPGPVAVGQTLSPGIGGSLALNAPVTPAVKQDCKNGGWVDLGFPNQGLCIAAVGAAASARR